MADNRFFRGQNRTDWFFATLLQTACDFGSPELVRNVADQFGHIETKIFSDPLGTIPDVTVILCQEYLFIVSSSTGGFLQWMGNVLGTAQKSYIGVPGKVSGYFGAVAESHYSSYILYVNDHVGSRKVVLIGFSLGGAAVTIEKAMLENRLHIPSACVAFGSPRVGNDDFVSGFPAENFARFQQNNDVVPGVPPPVWSSVGLHAGWLPYGELSQYTHAGDGRTLFLPNEIRPGDTIPPPLGVIQDINLGVWQTFHSQDLYARILRAGLPAVFVDGMDGYPKASRLPVLAQQTFRTFLWNITPPTPHVEIHGMIQLLLAFRNLGGDGLGFQEIYYISGSDPLSAIVPFVTGGGGGPGLTARAAFLSKSIEIYAVRTALVGAVKQTVLKKLVTPLQGADSNDMTDIEDCITYFGFNATRASRRQFHFRGIPKTYLAKSELLPAGRAALPLIETWLGNLLGYGAKVFTPATAASRGVVAVTKTTTVAQIHLTLDNAVTLTGPTRLRVTGMRLSPMLNGQWLTAGTGGVSSTDLALTGSEQYSPAPGTMGRVRVYATNAGEGESMTQWEFNGVASKKTGRVLFLRRGKRSPLLRRR